MAMVVASADPADRIAVYGESRDNFGVWGRSELGVGVRAESNNIDAPALEAKALRLNGKAAKFDGHVYVTGTITVEQDIIILNAGDIAEEFDVNDGDEAQPGTLMVFGADGRLTLSTEEYDPRVAGIVAGAGDLRPAMILDQRATREQRRAIALMGKVYCKVDADLAPVVSGDLLTSSPTPGHAMRVVDRSKAYGAIVGKAMSCLQSGRSLIPVLVMR
jgi:hypothetical protein